MGRARKLNFLLEVVLQGGFLQHQGLGAGGKTNENIKRTKFENDEFRRP